MGHGDRAFEIYRKLSPAYNEERSEIRKTEPYVYCQMVAGRDAPNRGEGKNSWLTGCAAWTFVNASQFLLGLTPKLEGFEINPVLPKEISSFTALRKVRGAELVITAQRGESYSLTVDGRKMDGKLVPWGMKGTVNVEVTYI